MSKTKEQAKAGRADKLSISLTSDMTAWLRRRAVQKGSNVSQVLRELIMPAFSARHAK